jgi:uncharacterized membrane protein
VSTLAELPALLDLLQVVITLPFIHYGPIDEQINQERPTSRWALAFFPEFLSHVRALGRRARAGDRLLPLFLSIFLLLPFLSAACKTKSIRSKPDPFPLLAGVFTACDLALWTTSLSYTTASNATLLGNTSPLWVALGAWLILKQKLTPAFWRGLVITLLGAALIMGTDFILHPRFGIGDVMAIFTGFFYGGYFLFTEKSRTTFDPVSHIWFVGIGASFALFIINLVLATRYRVRPEDLAGLPGDYRGIATDRLHGAGLRAWAPARLHRLADDGPAACLDRPPGHSPAWEIPTIWQGIGGMEIKSFTENGRVPVTVMQQLRVDGNHNGADRHQHRAYCR